MFYGSIPALVSPFRDGALDEPAFRALVRWQIESGSHGLAPAGTTGEAPALNAAEHRRVIEICVEEAKGKIPVIAGCGSNVTTKACALAEAAKAAGADAVLVAAPYYNKPSQEGIYAHYAALAQIGIPVIVYNIPGRSVIDINVQTLARLARLDMIAGLKDATADLGRVADQRQQCGANFVQLSGDDLSALGFAAHGGAGCISVTANVAPALCAQMHEALARADFTTACALNDALQPLHRALFADASPAPAKYALSLLGKCAPEVRLPLTPACDAARKAVEQALAALDLWSR